MKYTIPTFLLVILVLSCSKETNLLTNSINNTEVETTTTHYYDTIETGIPIPIALTEITDFSPPEEIAKGIPEVVRADENMSIITSPGIKLLKERQNTRIPGSSNASLPLKTAAVGEIKSVFTPETVPAGMPATTDVAYYNLQYLDVDQGLSASYVMDILEDSRGNLWVSSWTAGVSMYDSKSFTNYTATNGFLSNYIWDIFEDSKGNIWFGSDGAGVVKYDGNTFTQYNEKDGLTSSVIYKMIEDKDQNIWFATMDGLSKFDGEYFHAYKVENGLGGKIVSDVYYGPQNLLLMTTENGFSTFDGTAFVNYTEEDGLLSNKTTTIFEDSEENIWIGTLNKGVCMFDGYSFFSFDTSHGLAENEVTTIIEDEYKRIWIGTPNKGISIYDRSSFTKIASEQGLINTTILCLFQDSNLNIWIGTQGGLNKYNEKSFKNYTEKQGLGGPIIKGICEDQYGNMLFGHANGLSVFNGQTYENYGPEQGIGSSTIRGITQDHNGDFWFATKGNGAIHFDGEIFSHYGLESGLANDVVLCMYEDSDYNMWFGTSNAGLIKYDGERFYKLSIAEGLLSNTIRSICEDEKGNMWFGTNARGLEKFDGTHLTHYTEKEGLASSTILSLMVDVNGRLWIGNEVGGINIFSNERFLQIGLENGLSNDIIWSIVEDYDHKIWVGTEKGLNLIELDDENSITITKFGKLDGLKGMDFYPNSACLDSENKLWLGTGKALSVLDLNKYERIDKAPKLSITDIFIDRKSIDFRNLKRVFKRNYPNKEDRRKYQAYKNIQFESVYPFSNNPSNLELPYHLNHLTIRFSANDWTAPHKIKYRYKLEGESNEWHTLVNDNKVVYSHLLEGNYIFHLKAIGEAGIWSNTVNLKITIHPPWYRSLFAYFCYFILIIISIVATTTLRTKKLIRHRKLLEKLITKRTAETVKQKELVEEKNKEIIDSINYAKRIQNAILPSSGMVKRKLANAFIFFQPKDIVAGDFYWLEERDDKILLAAADCTGHGVPGAMISLVCNNTLSRTVREFNITDPPQILNKVRDMVIEAFTNSQEEVKDGMDIALISLDPNTNRVRFSGANNNLYIISKGKIKVLKGDRQPIGKYVVSKDFSLKEAQLYPGDTLYLFTDGYADQFGGERGKKLKIKQFMQLLLEVQHLTMRQQKIELTAAFNHWKGELEQVDDVCVIGLKI